jgi:plasmid stabilization system protein ParE
VTDTPWTVVFAAAAEADLALIEAHLTQSYESFGEPPADAPDHARDRVEAILATAERLATAPFRGERHDDLMPGLRQLALDRAIYWFLPDAEGRQVRVLAVFFGGQDHQRHMLVRLLGPTGP